MKHQYYTAPWGFLGFHSLPINDGKQVSRCVLDTYPLKLPIAD